MRPIKFRGKCLDTGKWIEGYGCVMLGYESVVIHKNGNNLMQHTAIDPETLGQFTGLTDCNGTKIWEGDIVVFSYPHIDARIKGIVKWDAEWSCFALFKPDSKYAFESDWSRIINRNVIGNRFDNPELMEVLR